MLTEQIEKWLNKPEDVIDLYKGDETNGFIAVTPANFIRIYDVSPRLFRDDDALYQSICNILRVKPVKSRNGLVANAEQCSIWWNRKFGGVYLWKTGVTTPRGEVRTKYTKKYSYTWEEKE